MAFTSPTLEVAWHAFRLAPPPSLDAPWSVADSAVSGASALAIYDTNADGIIDAHDDPYWDKFRVWIDFNHDGISQPAELHTLDELGITAISLKCTELRTVDGSKNEFRLKGRVTLKDGSKRSIYDVNLDTIPVPWSQAATK